MHRYFLKLSFTGDNYHGWQVQDNAHSVQQELNTSLSRLLNENIKTVGAGRTDAGVHATEFYAHFDSERDDIHIDPREWVCKFNLVLPFDMAVQAIIPVHPTAHARFDALSRKYEYIINRTKDPFQQKRAYYLYGKLDKDLMNKASEILFEYKDFGCFSKSRTQVKTNICEIIEAGWEEKNDSLVFTITANRFLRNMVRAIVGTMIEVGKEKTSLNEFRKIIKGRNRSDSGFSVPAHGLYLTKIEYPKTIFL